MAISDIVWQSIKDIESKTSQVMIENLDFNEYFKWIPADEPDKKEGFCKPFLN